MVDILVLGLGVGGFAAARKAREIDFNASITALDPWAYDSYSPCGLPFILDGTVERMDALYHRLPLTDMNINRVVGTAVKIDTVGRVAHYLMPGGGEETINFEKLIIATGAQTSIPPIENAEALLGKGVFVFNNPLDAQEVLKALDQGAKNAVVIGSGPKGCEIAFALKNRGSEVTLCEALGHVMPGPLDSDMAKEVQTHLEMNDIKVRCGVTVSSIVGTEKAEAVLIGEEQIPADLIILATGAEPDLKIFREAGIQTTVPGIIVKDDMSTSIEGIYACGDIAVCFSAIDNNPIMNRLATSALRTGIVAGNNAAGGSMTYPGTTSSFACVLKDMEIASVGFNASAAKERGFDIKQVKNRGKDRPEFFPGWSEITLKLIFDKSNKRLIGAQAVGGAGVIARVDHLGVAIALGATVDDLYLMEFSYTPPRAEGTDIISKTTAFAMRKLK